MLSNYLGGKYKKFRKWPDRKRLPSVAIVREYLSEVKFADRKTTLLGATNPHVKKKNYYLLLHNTDNTTWLYLH